MPTTQRTRRLPSIREAAPLADRVRYSTAEPTIALPAPYEYIAEPYPEPVDADIQRFVVYYAPTAPEPVRADYPTARAYFEARRAMRADQERLDRLRTKVGAIETRIGQIGVWVAYRPDRRTAPFMREVGEYGHANLAIREIVRIDSRRR